MIGLPEPRPLTPDRALSVREELQVTMLADRAPAATPRRARPLVVGSLLVCLLVVGGLAAAVAITVTAAERSSSEAIVVDSDMLDVLYRGQRITQDDLVALTRDGLGTFTAADVDTERDLHATRAFDTLDELDAYSAEYLAWQRARADGQDVETWGSLHP